jgi:hypothetical protein
MVQRPQREWAYSCTRSSAVNETVHHFSTFSLQTEIESLISVSPNMAVEEIGMKCERSKAMGME